MPLDSPARHGKGKEPINSLSPTITLQPQNKSILSNQTVALTVSADGDTLLQYQWYQGTSSDTTTPVSGATNANLTTPMLTATTSYWVRVTNDYKSTDSSTATVTVSGTPSVPTDLNGTAISPSSILLTWTASTGNVAATGYNVYRDGAPIGTSTTASYSDTGLTAATAYAYSISAYTAAGDTSAQTASVSVTTQLSGAQTCQVTDVTTLTAALADAAANPSATFTINLAPGTYTLAPSALADLSIAGTTLQGPTSDSPAILDGSALTDGVIFNITASVVTLSNLKLTNAANHAIAIQSGANTGTIANCIFSRTTEAAGAMIDGTGCDGWTVTGNTISEGVADTSATAEPAIHFYAEASNTIITDNIILNCDQGIGLGSATSTHTSGTIRNNMIADDRTTGNPGAGISLESTTNTVVDNNTLYSTNSYDNSIEYNNCSGVSIRNNLASKAITGSTSMETTLTTNYTPAQATWFIAPASADLRLNSAVPNVVDAGTPIDDLTMDIEGDPGPPAAATTSVPTNTPAAPPAPARVAVRRARVVPVRRHRPRQVRAAVQVPAVAEIGSNQTQAPAGI